MPTLTSQTTRRIAIYASACILASSCGNPIPSTSGDDLLEAAAKNDMARVILLMQEDADVTDATVDGVTPLHHAALLGNGDMATLFLEHGADVTAVTDSEETVLHWAANEGNRETIGVLLRGGVEVNARNADGQTALDLVQTRDGDFAELVEYLRRHDAKLGRELDEDGPSDGQVVAPKFRGQ